MMTGSSRLTYNYSGNSTPNRLDSTAVGSATTTYAYNQNGWMTARGENALTYDYRGLTTGYGSARYLMDPDRRCVKKTVGTAVTYYLRGPGGSVLAEYSGQNLSARYVYAGSRRIARIGGGGAIYYLADHLGSTRSLVDGEGTVTAAYDYWPYGKVLASSGTGSTHFRFTGHERDAESGLDYMLKRNYAYDVGRFLRPDPMQDEYPAISPYAYAANNPFKYVDPDGRKIVFASKEVENRFEVYFANLRKTEIGSKLYNHVQGADEEFLFNFSLDDESKRGRASIAYGYFPPWAQHPDEMEDVWIQKTGSTVSINESLIMGLGEMVESTIIEELFHLAEALGKLESAKNTKEFYTQSVLEQAMYRYYDRPHEARAKEAQEKFRRQWEGLQKQQQQ
ncbi:MAG: RHS repeat-associated core domain-containing protein [Gemmatimonadetes bacterium]|nr:RHS repeat-associated core domain-containing protein [Gemmatimonadota bacterium]